MGIPLIEENFGELKEITTVDESVGNVAIPVEEVTARIGIEGEGQDTKLTLSVAGAQRFRLASENENFTFQMNPNPNNTENQRMVCNQLQRDDASVLTSCESTNQNSVWVLERDVSADFNIDNFVNNVRVLYLSPFSGSLVDIPIIINRQAPQEPVNDPEITYDTETNVITVNNSANVVIEEFTTEFDNSPIKSQFPDIDGFDLNSIFEVLPETQCSINEENITCNIENSDQLQLSVNNNAIGNIKIAATNTDDTTQESVFVLNSSRFDTDDVVCTQTEGVTRFEVSWQKQFNNVFAYTYSINNDPRAITPASLSFDEDSTIFTFQPDNFEPPNGPFSLSLTARVLEDANSTDYEDQYPVATVENVNCEGQEDPQPDSQPFRIIQNKSDLYIADEDTFTLGNVSDKFNETPDGCTQDLNSIDISCSNENPRDWKLIMNGNDIDALGGSSINDPDDATREIPFEELTARRIFTNIHVNNDEEAIYLQAEIPGTDIEEIDTLGITRFTIRDNSGQPYFSNIEIGVGDCEYLGNTASCEPVRDEEDNLVPFSGDIDGGNFIANTDENRELINTFFGITGDSDFIDVNDVFAGFISFRLDITDMDNINDIIDSIDVSVVIEDNNANQIGEPVLIDILYQQQEQDDPEEPQNPLVIQNGNRLLIQSNESSAVRLQATQNAGFDNVDGIIDTNNLPNPVRENNQGYDGQNCVSSDLDILCTLNSERPLDFILLNGNLDNLLIDELNSNGESIQDYSGDNLNNLKINTTASIETDATEGIRDLLIQREMNQNKPYSIQQIELKNITTIELTEDQLVGIGCRRQNNDQDVPSIICDGGDDGNNDGFIDYRFPISDNAGENDNPWYPIPQVYVNVADQENQPIFENVEIPVTTNSSIALVQTRELLVIDGLIDAFEISGDFIDAIDQDNLPNFGGDVPNCSAGENISCIRGNDQDDEINRWDFPLNLEDQAGPIANRNEVHEIIQTFTEGQQYIPADQISYVSFTRNNDSTGLFVVGAKRFKLVSNNGENLTDNVSLSTEGFPNPDDIKCAIDNETKTSFNCETDLSVIIWDITYTGEDSITDFTIEYQSEFTGKYVSLPITENSIIEQ